MDCSTFISWLLF